MITALLFIVGAVLALWITWRNPGYAERYNWWPMWKEWAVQAFGVALMSAAFLRVFVPWMVST